MKNFIEVVGADNHKYLINVNAIRMIQGNGNTSIILLDSPNDNGKRSFTVNLSLENLKSLLREAFS